MTEPVTEKRGSESPIKLSGRITIDTAPDLRAQLLQRLNSPDCRVLTVDFCDVVYMDTSVVAVLLEILRAARQLGKQFELSNLPDGQRFMLESTKLLRLFVEANAPCNR